MEVPYFAVQEQTIWGATAMMLNELLSLPAMRYAPGADPVPSDRAGDRA